MLVDLWLRDAAEGVTCVGDAVREPSIGGSGCLNGHAVGFHVANRGS